MKKITEIKEIKYRTVREKDALGNRSTKQVPFAGFRKVNTVTNGVRFAHFFVDLTCYYLIYHLILVIESMTVDLEKDSVFSLMLIYYTSLIYLFSFPIYYIVFEYFFQKTPGKFLTKTRVIDLYGNKPDLGTIALRNIIRLVPFERFSCFDERGWHDKWSDTFVVKDEEYFIIKELLEKEMTDSK
jgi:uncharacterized RDD family membrane protein YckC